MRMLHNATQHFQRSEPEIRPLDFSEQSGHLFIHTVVQPHGTGNHVGNSRHLPRAVQRFPAEFSPIVLTATAVHYEKWTLPAEQIALLPLLSFVFDRFVAE